MVIEEEKGRLSSYKQIINFIGKPFVLDILLIGTIFGILSTLDKSDSQGILEATKEILTGSNSAIAITTASSISLYLITLAVYWLYLKKNTPVTSNPNNHVEGSKIPKQPLLNQAPGAGSLKEEKKINTSPIVELLEPAIAKEKNGAYIGIAKPGQKLFFPHVDSCLAIMLEFKNGNIIGGHVPVLWDDKQEFSWDCMPINLLRITTEMQTKYGYKNSDITNIYCLGDTNWRDSKLIYQVLGNKCNFIPSKRNGVDVYMERGCRPEVISCSQEFQSRNSFH